MKPITTYPNVSVEEVQRAEVAQLRDRAGDHNAARIVKLIQHVVAVTDGQACRKADAGGGQTTLMFWRTVCVYWTALSPSHSPLLRSTGYGP